MGTDLDMAWIAGLLEGEGSFHVAKGGNDRGHRISCMMTDEDVVRKAHAVSGVGFVYGPYQRSNPESGEPYKPIWTWVVQHRRDILPLLEAIRMHMGKRRGARIDELMASIKGAKSAEQLSSENSQRGTARGNLPEWKKHASQMVKHRWEKNPIGDVPLDWPALGELFSRRGNFLSFLSNAGSDWESRSYRVSISTWDETAVRRVHGAIGGLGKLRLSGKRWLIQVGKYEEVKSLCENLLPHMTGPKAEKAKGLLAAMQST